MLPLAPQRWSEWEEDERTPEDLFLSVLNPHLSTNSLVRCGSWSGHKNEEVLLEAFGRGAVDPGRTGAPPRYFFSIGLNRNRPGFFYYF